MSSPSTRKVWDGQGDQQLLLAVIAQQTVAINWDAVATQLGVTPRAIQERLKRIKKILAEDAGGAHVSAKRPSNKNASDTPKKQKTTKDGKGKQVAKESDDEGGSELDGNVAQEMQASDHAGQEEMLDAPVEKEENPDSIVGLGIP